MIGMKKLINDIDAVVKEQLEGMALAYAGRLKLCPEPAFIYRADAPVEGKVALISGGGSGHEPMHGGFVGVGMLDSACPAPVTVSMDQSACAYHRRATETIQNTDIPWVYSSALFGQGRIAIDVSLQEGLALPRLDAVATVDGKLNDPCWKTVRAIAFQNTPFSMLGASIGFQMFRDADNIYFGYRCRSATNGLGDANRSDPSSEDGLEIYIADPARRTGIHRPACPGKSR